MSQGKKLVRKILYVSLSSCTQSLLSLLRNVQKRNITWIDVYIYIYTERDSQKDQTDAGEARGDKHRGGREKKGRGKDKDGEK